MQPDNPCQDKQQPLPFGAGILPDDNSPANAQPVSASEPALPESDEKTPDVAARSEDVMPSKIEPAVETPKQPEPEAAAENVAPADSQDAIETRESSDQPEPDDPRNQDDPPAEKPEDDDIMEFEIIEPPDYQDEERAFSKLPPGPREAVRFDERPRQRPRRSREKAGARRRDRRPQRKPEQPKSFRAKLLRWISGLFGKKN